MLVRVLNHPRSWTSSTPNTEGPSKQLKLPELPFLPLFAGLKATLKKGARNLLFATVIASNLMSPMVAAAQTGAQGAPTTGAPLTELVVQQAQHDNLQRFEDARPLLTTFIRVSNEVNEAQRLLRSHDGRLELLQGYHREAQEKLQAWTPADTTGMSEDDAFYAVHEAKSKKEALARTLASYTSALAEVPDRAPLMERVNNTQTEFAQVQALLAPLLADAIQAAEGFGYRALSSGSAEEPLTWIGLTAVLEAWEAKTGQKVADLPTNAQAWMWRLASVSPELVDHSLNLIASATPTEASDVIALAFSGRGALTTQARARMTAVAEATGYTPKVMDAQLLGKLGEARFSRFLERLPQLEAAGFTWTESLHPDTYDYGYQALTDLGRLLPLAGAADGALKIGVEPASGLWINADTDFASLLTATEAWTARGYEANADALPAIGVLSMSGPQSARIEALMDRVELGSHPNAPRILARLAMFKMGGVRADSTFHAKLEQVAEQLGRKPSVNEAWVLFEAHYKEKDFSELLPKAEFAQAQRNDPQASFDDWYVWANATQAQKDRSPAELTRRISANLSEPVPRLDQAAEYSESFEVQASALSVSDLLRIDLLQSSLQRPDIREAIGAQIKADLANDKSELGGAFVFEDGNLAFKPLTPSSFVNNNGYVFPSDQMSPYASVVTAHLHAADHEHNEGKAGPSSMYEGRTADRMVSWLDAKSELVITHLQPGKFAVDYYTPEGAVVDLGSFSYGR